MVRFGLCVAIAAVAGAMGLSGCWGEPARSAEAPKTANRVADSLAGGGGSGERASAGRPRGPHKDAAVARAFVSIYRNREEGISFVYPRNYVLEEGEVEEHSFFLKRQEEQDAEGEGAQLVATVLIPEDSYPNTTFEHGSVQLLVREEASAEGCRELVTAAGGDAAGSRSISGIEFAGGEQEDVIGGMRVLERVYAGYAKERCYEFVATVAVEDAADAEGFKRAADSGKIMKQLEKIIASVEILDQSATDSEAAGEESSGRL